MTHLDSLYLPVGRYNVKRLAADTWRQNTVFRRELVETTLLEQLTLVHDEDTVRVANSIESVRDDYSRAIEAR